MTKLAEPAPLCDGVREGEDLWVFGYGSLMWRPGFAYIEAVPAALVGYQRRFCVYSTHHRGTAERPGLVLGLDRGGTAHGLAFRVAARDRVETLAYLRAREQVNGVYREVHVPLQLQRHGAGAATDREPGTGGGQNSDEVPGLAFVVERAHPSYAGNLSVARQARIIRSAIGLSGPNIDYLANTLARAEALGLRSDDLRRVMIAASAFFQRAAVPLEAAPERANWRQGTPTARTLFSCRELRRVGPRQPNIGERRRFHHRRPR